MHTVIMICLALGCGYDAGLWLSEGVYSNALVFFGFSIGYCGLAWTFA